MAQRKSPASNRPSGKSANRPGARPGASSASTTKSAKPVSGSPAGKPGARTPMRKPPAKGRSIVNQKQTPWGLIATTAAIVVFAAAVVWVVVASSGGSSGSSSTTGGQKVDVNDPYRQPALPAAMKIKGVTYRVEGQHDHVTGTIKYDSSPPVGGNHSQYWASCTGTVYDHQIANENAVHMLEHGAVWITYNPKTATKADVTTLEGYVKGQDRLALSPYAGLRAKVTLQAWGYQLFVNSASDPRIAQFIATLKYNPKTTPENASCTDPYWTADTAKKSRPGHPVD